MRYWLVMPAAGSGRRFQGGTPKQYTPLLGRTVIEWALAPFLADPRCVHAVVAIAAADLTWPRVAARLASERLSATTGGEARSLSVRRGLAALADRADAGDWVLVHDAARPCLDPRDLEELIMAVTAHGRGGILGARATDTLKQAQTDARGHQGPPIARTVDRADLWRAFTPQMFRFGPLCAALDAAHSGGRHPSDEAQALEWAGASPLLVEGRATNLKLTSGEDLALAEAILRARSAP
ncbi:MAG TPA: 2-C-methyl-D-erythritol 4-phosphate cytidylyltransferase [Steroidobacteraceae bacterium]|nr:2-C-methyl-D-erythritol 4-phosphate cytidylyltransferase [Steroidobacteraceae bacterium]